MATIQPFLAIRPNPLYAGELVFTTPQAESVTGNYLPSGNLAPLKTLLETGARQRPETPEGQANAYRDINDTLYVLLKSERLLSEQTPGIYVYEVVHTTYRQTGIWALTSLADYTAGTIKVHELTLADSIRRLKNYRHHTGLEGSPILLTYPPSLSINRIIADTKANSIPVALDGLHARHNLWKIEDTEVLQQLTGAFARIPVVYLADGHHRIGSAASLAAEQQLNGQLVYNTISSLYMASDQLRIQEYDRVVTPDVPVEKGWLLEQLSGNFDIEASAQPVQPRNQHCIGLYVQKQWYTLFARAHTYLHNSAAGNLDAALLQNLVLAPIFGIDDPKTDPRLKSVGGEKAMEEIQAITAAMPEVIIFTICPLTLAQLTAVADAGEILPPKSTWIVPKIPYGLLLQRYPV